MRSTKSHETSRNCLCLRASRALLCLYAAFFSSFPGYAKTDAPPGQLALSQPLTVRWKFNADTTNLSPATDGNTIYLPLLGGALVALNASDGQFRWKSDPGGQLSAAPAADGQGVYVATEYAENISNERHVHGTLRALGKEAGVTLWMRTLQAPIRGALIAGKNAVFGGAVDGSVYAFDKQTGLTLWSTQYTAAFSSQPRLSEDRLFIGSEDGTLLALDQKTGRIVWRYKTKGPIRGPVAIANGVVYFGSGDGYVYAYREAHTNLIWRRRTGAGVQAVAAVENGLVAASLDNFAYFYSLNGGRHLWQHQLTGRLTSQPLTAADGALFAPLSSDNATVLSLKDGKPVNTLPIGEENSSTASPISAGGIVFLTTPHALLAFSAPAPRP